MASPRHQISSRFFCVKCSRSYRTQESLEEHYRGSPAHPTCPQCGIGLKTEHAKIEHLQKDHPRIRCSSPCRTVLYVSELQTHLWDSPIHPICVSCHRGFNNTAALAAHLSTEEHADSVMRRTHFERPKDSPTSTPLSPVSSSFAHKQSEADSGWVTLSSTSDTPSKHEHSPIGSPVYSPFGPNKSPMASLRGTLEIPRWPWDKAYTTPIPSTNASSPVEGSPKWPTASPVSSGATSSGWVDASSANFNSGTLSSLPSLPEIYVTSSEIATSILKQPHQNPGSSPSISSRCLMERTTTSSTSNSLGNQVPSIPASAKSPMSLSLHCRICKRDPCKDVVATKCGHLFCKVCISDEIVKTATCPVCKERLLLYCLITLDLAK